MRLSPSNVDIFTIRPFKCKSSLFWLLDVVSRPPHKLYRKEHGNKRDIVREETIKDRKREREKGERKREIKGRGEKFTSRQNFHEENFQRDKLRTFETGIP